MARRKRRTKEEFSREIRSLQDAGVALNTKNMRIHHRDVYDDGLWLYTTWQTALEAQGIDYATVRKKEYSRPRKHRTKDDCVNEIRNRARLGLPLNIKACMEDVGWLYGAVPKYFESWDDFLRFAGFDPELVRKRPVTRQWTRELFIQMLKTRAGAGLPINSDAIAETDPGFVEAGRRLFGDYSAALAAAGFDSESVYLRHALMTEEEIIKELQRRHREGKPLNYEALVEEGDHRLLNCMRRVFGSCRQAIEASGLDYDKIRLTEVWSEAKIIVQIQKLAAQGKPLNAAYIVVHHKALHHASIHHCGSWENAVEKAGFSYDRIIRKWYFRRRKSFLKPYHRSPNKT